MLLVADPQLVDPHTYPDRPWPLSSLTIVYTDLYLRRAYRKLQRSLRPDSTLFLGDLFDGGREWGTADYKSPEVRYKGYGASFWIREYVRYSNLFLQNWFHGPVASAAAPFGRKLIASVPGNHDLGFASGIDPTVKGRFDAYFGPLNRVDVLGNHSFVTLDTVSLSAMDQVDPNTGAHGGGDASDSATASSHLWRPVEDFLTAAKVHRHRAVQHEWNQLTRTRSGPTFQPILSSLDSRSAPKTQPPVNEVPSSQFPTLILSHVPLFRPDNTPCGPDREGRPSIPLSAGYQYQNVLTPLISSDIIKHLTAEEVVQIYSGDDHDYCEITHSEYTGAIKEITVKSMSWAMGVRKPGVQLISLWNPVDLEKIATDAMTAATDIAGDASKLPAPKDTVQNHLCLLPDQLSIFIRYAQLLGVTLLIVAIDTLRAFRQQGPQRQRQKSAAGYEKSNPLLPVTQANRKDTSARSRSSSVHLNGHTKDPFAPTHASTVITTADSDEDDWGMPKGKRRKSQLPQSLPRLFATKIWQVAWPVLLVYLFLFWQDS